jgi:hypothetical protein
VSDHAQDPLHVGLVEVGQLPCGRRDHAANIGAPSNRHLPAMSSAYDRR